MRVKEVCLLLPDFMSCPNISPGARYRGIPIRSLAKTAIHLPLKYWSCLFCSFNVCKMEEFIASLLKRMCINFTDKGEALYLVFR